ncbi:MAG: TetR/AcrR family transcriptional regulator [Acidobacteriota bacterium]
MPRETQFDIDETLEKAGDAFWRHGFEATSMSALLAAMGIQKGSFYNTYGSKHEVYLRSLERYAATRRHELSAAVQGQTGLEAIRTHFEIIHDECVGSSGDLGCMIINCALERAREDEEARAIVQRSLARHEALLAAWVREGQGAGELRVDLDADAAAKSLMSFVMGMRVYSRSGGDPEAVRTLADAALRLIRSAPP